jgi:hypothetical protein
MMQLKFLDNGKENDNNKVFNNGVAATISSRSSPGGLREVASEIGSILTAGRWWKVGS